MIALAAVLVTPFSVAATSAMGGIVATLPVGHFPDSSAVNPVTDRVYVVNYQDSTVSVIDGSTNAVLTTLAVASSSCCVPGTGPQGVAVNPATNMVYVSSDGLGLTDNTLTVINGTTNAVVTTVSVGYFPWWIAINPSTNRIYVTALFSPTVSVVDGSTNTVIGTIYTGTGSSGIDVNPVTNLGYVALSNNIGFGGPVNSVDVFSLATNNVIGTISVGNLPLGVAVNPLTNHVYVANADDGTVSVVAGSANSVVATIPLSPRDGGLGIDLATNRVYVSSTLSSATQVISVINGRTNTVVKSFSIGACPTNYGAYMIGVDSLTHTVYMTHSSPPATYDGTLLVIKD